MKKPENRCDDIRMTNYVPCDDGAWRCLRDDAKYRQTSVDYEDPDPIIPDEAAARRRAIAQAILQELGDDDDA